MSPIGRWCLLGLAVALVLMAVGCENGATTSEASGVERIQSSTTLADASSLTVPISTQGNRSSGAETNRAGPELSSDLGPAPVWVDDDHWRQADLPRIFSDLRVADGVALFEVVESGEASLVGVRASDGEVLYRLPSHPAGRLRGVAGALFVFEEEGVVLRRYVEDVDGEAQLFVAGHDIATGEQLWAQPAGAGGDFFPCGDLACQRSAEGQWAYDLLTGRNRRVSTHESATVFVQGEHGFLLMGGDGLTGSFDDGFTPDWVISYDEIDAMHGIEIPENSGWGTVLTADEAYGAHYFAFDQTAWTGFDVSTGEVTWTRLIEGRRCFWFDGLVEVIVECAWDGDQLSLYRLSIEDGQEVWTSSLGSAAFAEVSVDGEMIQVSTDTGIVHIAADTGERLPEQPHHRCVVSSGWPDINHDWLDEQLVYRATEHFGRCAGDGSLIELSELVETDRAALLETTADGGAGWRIGVDDAGRLAGLRVSPE